MGEVNDLTDRIIGSAVEVHRLLGPGLLESAYQRAMEFELGARGLRFEAQKSCTVTYKGLSLGESYRIDLLVEKRVVVELKSVDLLDDSHEAQVLTYMRFAPCGIGLIINFRGRLLKDGIRRFTLSPSAFKSAISNN